MSAPTVAEVERMLELSRFLVRWYARSRSPIALVRQCLLHARLVWMRAQVELLVADEERAR